MLGRAILDYSVHSLNIRMQLLPYAIKTHPTGSIEHHPGIEVFQGIYGPLSFSCWSWIFQKRSHDIYMDWITMPMIYKVGLCVLANGCRINSYCGILHDCRQDLMQLNPRLHDALAISGL